LKEKQGLVEHKKRAIAIWNKKNLKKKEEYSEDLKKILEEMKTPSLMLPFDNKIKLRNFLKKTKSTQ
jgi:hypothetical protein